VGLEGPLANRDEENEKKKKINHWGPQLAAQIEGHQIGGGREIWKAYQNDIPSGRPARDQFFAPIEQIWRWKPI